MRFSFLIVYLVPEDRLVGSTVGARSPQPPAPIIEKPQDNIPVVYHGAHLNIEPQNLSSEAFAQDDRIILNGGRNVRNPKKSSIADLKFSI
jgi:hypothetical protein